MYKFKNMQLLKALDESGTDSETNTKNNFFDALIQLLFQKWGIFKVYDIFKVCT